jgi:hypothetical protein
MQSWRNEIWRISVLGGIGKIFEGSCVKCWDNYDKKECRNEVNSEEG